MSISTKGELCEINKHLLHMKKQQEAAKAVGFLLKLDSPLHSKAKVTQYRRQVKEFDRRINVVEEIRRKIVLRQGDEQLSGQRSGTGVNPEGQGHSGQGHSGQGHSGQGHSGQGHSGQGHSGQGHSGQGHPGASRHGGGVTPRQIASTNTGNIGNGNNVTNIAVTGSDSDSNQGRDIPFPEGENCEQYFRPVEDDSPPNLD